MLMRARGPACCRSPNCWCGHGSSRPPAVCGKGRPGQEELTEIRGNRRIPAWVTE